MMDAKIDRNLGAKLLSVGSLLAIAAAAAVAFWPQPTTAGQQREIDRLRVETQAANDKAEALRQSNATRLWNEPTQSIGPKALDIVTRGVKSRGLKLSTFRPQKAVQADGVTQLPFLLAVEGPYPVLLGFIREIENPKSKLALTMLQFSSSDAASDRVTVTMSISAFTHSAIESTPKVETTSNKTATGGNDGKGV